MPRRKRKNDDMVDIDIDEKRAKMKSWVWIITIALIGIIIYVTSNELSITSRLLNCNSKPTSKYTEKAK